MIKATISTNRSVTYTEFSQVLKILKTRGQVAQWGALANNDPLMRWDFFVKYHTSVSVEDFNFLRDHWGHVNY